jgi:Flp pilus assembly pilin Flp
MRRLISKLWTDDCGAILSFEWILMATILVLGMIVGLKTVQGAVLNEFEEIGSAVGGISQSYKYGGSKGCCSKSNGGSYHDRSANEYRIDTCTSSFDRGCSVCEE